MAFEIEEVIGGVEKIELPHESEISEDRDLPHESEISEDKDPHVLLPDPSSSVHENETEMTRKRLRTLKKKLKQIDELEEKIASGEIKPDKEQLKKISKKENFLEEVKVLSLYMFNKNLL